MRGGGGIEVDKCVFFCTILRLGGASESSFSMIESVFFFNGWEGIIQLFPSLVKDFPYIILMIKGSIALALSRGLH